MRILDGRLAVLLGLLALAGLAVALPRAVPGDSDRRTELPAVPPAVDGWTVAGNVPDEVLPFDSRARESVRWTYSKGGRTVFVSIARYRSRHDPGWRPSISVIAPERGAARVRHERLPIRLDGALGRAIPVNLVSVQGPDGHLSVFYWYQVGGKTIADVFHLRLALLLTALRLRPQEVWLVRVATLDPEGLEDFLRAFYPRLSKALTS